MLRGGTRGNVLNGESPDHTLFMKAVLYQDADLQMPPSGQLPAEVIEDFRAWIAQGAVDPRVEETRLTAGQPHATPGDRAASHWAYRAPELRPIPAIDSQGWVRDPIDAIVFEKQHARGIAPNPEADKRTLVRRLYYDLLGLPPTQEQIQAALMDESEAWYERLVDDLLQSPHFGERMARYWMDLTRFADTKGYVFMEDRAYPHAYRYRDWLIRSFNQDLPYNDFIKYQLAADRLDPENAQGHLDAMGMLTLGRRFLNNQNDIADDRIDVVTRGLLAMTVGCARCHDHKYDPVKMADYYSLHGVFVNSEEPGGDPSPMRLVDRAEQRPSYILLRGQPGNRGDQIERQFVRFLSKENPRPLNDGSGRIDLANAIVDPSNPLTARVYVNRVWAWLFGSPLVDTPSDFGLRSDPPIQIEVLDRLAIEFVQDGWSTKRLVARLVKSSTYRQSSQYREEVALLDPENRLWWRTIRRRMDMESYRDALLNQSGRIDLAIGGASEKIHEPPYSNRRTLYAYIDRQNLPEFFRSFDFATPDSHVPRRAVTTVPQQGLFALNNDWIQQLASSLAGRLDSVGTELDPSLQQSTRIDKLFQWVLAREATAEERAMAAQFLDEVRVDTTDTNSMSGWAMLAQSLMISNEFCFID